MRLRGSLSAIACSLVLLATGGPSVLAQSESIMDFLRRDQERQRLQRPRAQPRGPVFLRPPPADRRVVRRPRPAPETVVVRDTPDAARPQPTAFVAVIGDSMGEMLAQGLVTELTARPEIAVQRKARGSSGLVRDDFFDWPKAVAELLAAADAPTVTVMMIGTNDRQPLRENGESHEPGSDRWKEIYVARVRAVVAAFQARKAPLVWVGLPPMLSPRYSEEMLALNALFRAEVEKGGGHWVDIWEVFADGQGRFAMHGPDVSGQTARLRTGDGIHFTRAGAQKAAHFVDVLLKRLIEQPAGAPVIALPAAPAPLPAAPLTLQPGEPPEPAEPPPPPPKPVAGPIQPLARPEPTPGGALIAAPPPRASLIEDAAANVLVGGRPPEPKPGRADDFRWLK